MSTRRARAVLPAAAFALLAAALILPAPGQEGDEPLESGAVERVETRIVQVDVSVVDRKSGGRRSVPGLTKDMFRLRVNGKRLSAEEYARVTLDEVCGQPGGLPPELDRRSLIVMADFNYLDGQMRHDTAEALRGLAAEGLPEGYRVKVLGFTRSLMEIMPFSEDPEDLLAAADFIETTSGLGGPAPASGPILATTTLAQARDARRGAEGSVAGPAAEYAGTPSLVDEAAFDASTATPPDNVEPPPTAGYDPNEPPGTPTETIGAQGGGRPDVPFEPQDATTLRETLSVLPSIDFGQEVSSDPWKAKAAEVNPGTVLSGTLQRDPAFSGLAGGLGALQGQIEVIASLVPAFGGRQQRERGLWDPRASLAAVEAVLRGHAGLPGRKALILFTGEGFDLANEEDLERETAAAFQAAQEGFTVWVVDARGIMGDGEARSDLVTMLANDTGGETLRDTTDLGLVFARARDALDCYYLFSIPVDRSDEPEILSVQVALDTRDRPELFGYTVRHTSKIRLEPRPVVREQARVAALLNPSDWQTLPVRADLTFPVESGRRFSVLPVEVAVPLAALEYREVPEGGVEASFLVDVAVDRNGNEAVCLLPPRGDAVLHTLRLPGAPAPDERGHLIVRQLCPWSGKGVYTLRAVVTDTASESPAAAHALFRIDPEPARNLTVEALRVGHNTGQEHLLVGDGPDAGAVTRDLARAAFVPLDEEEPAGGGDKLLFRYVLCGPSREEAWNRLRRVVYRREDEGARLLYLLPGSEGTDPAQQGWATSPFCVEIQDEIPPSSLSSGSYGFAVVAAGPEPRTRGDLEAALAEGEGAGLLGQVPFEIR